MPNDRRGTTQDGATARGLPRRSLGEGGSRTSDGAVDHS
jgi:hypothetical protein